MSEVNHVRHILTLSQKELSARRQALNDILSREGIKFNAEESSDGLTVNFTFTSRGGNSGYLFTAHYDNTRGSYGANDNMAGVCVIIDLCLALERSNIGAEFLLTDGEEYGNMGAEMYCESHGLNHIDGVIVLDMCGYGDNIVLRVRGSGKIFGRFTGYDILQRNNARTVKYIPPGDDIIFRKYHVPVLSVSIVPKWDVQYLKALASYGDRLLGMPPEFEMMLSQMEVTQTIQGGPKDSPEFVQPEAVNRVYSFLFEAMTHESPPKLKLTEIFRRLIS